MSESKIVKLKIIIKSVFLELIRINFECHFIFKEKKKVVFLNFRINSQNRSSVIETPEAMPY